METTTNDFSGLKNHMTQKEEFMSITEATAKILPLPMRNKIREQTTMVLAQEVIDLTLNHLLVRYNLRSLTSHWMKKTEELHKEYAKFAFQGHSNQAIIDQATNIAERQLSADFNNPGNSEIDASQRIWVVLSWTLVCLGNTRDISLIKI